MCPGQLPFLLFLCCGPLNNRLNLPCNALLSQTTFLGEVIKIRKSRRGCFPFSGGKQRKHNLASDLLCCFFCLLSAGVFTDLLDEMSVIVSGNNNRFFGIPFMECGGHTLKVAGIKRGYRGKSQCFSKAGRRSVAFGYHKNRRLLQSLHSSHGMEASGLAAVLCKPFCAVFSNILHRPNFSVYILCGKARRLPIGSKIGTGMGTNSLGNHIRRHFAHGMQPIQLSLDSFRGRFMQGGKRDGLFFLPLSVSVFQCFPFCRRQYAAAACPTNFLSTAVVFHVSRRTSIEESNVKSSLLPRSVFSCGNPVSVSIHNRVFSLNYATNIAQHFRKLFLWMDCGGLFHSLAVGQPFLQFFPVSRFSDVPASFHCIPFRA